MVGLNEKALKEAHETEGYCIIELGSRRYCKLLAGSRLLEVRGGGGGEGEVLRSLHFM